MTQKSKVSRIALLAGILLVSLGYGEETRHSPTKADSMFDALTALKASIPRRELELALRERGEVMAEVKQRIEELGLNASVDKLTDLLEQRAHLELDADRCRLAGGNCHMEKAALATVEARFQETAGLSAREFRSGRRANPARDAGLAGATGRRSLTKAAGDTCTCAFTVYSLDRWMNPYWGLECNNHSSHGVCSNNVDSAHSPGSGAMTGDVDLYFGGNHANRDCPDDHYTCFRGPSTDHVGEWGNTCSCDTWHSQYYNPYVSWYGGALSDPTEVNQLSTGWMSVAGACNEVSVSVKEFIEENDPWCCDDPMGDLWASMPLADGYGTTSAPASTQNCNGGSQSGVYPYCGTFGATIKVAYNCSTYSPPPPPECDPEAVQSCYDQGWNWDPATCSCARCPPPPVNCPYWDEFSCLCYNN